MTVDGLTFVNTGLLYRDFIPAGTAFMVPVFGANNLVGSDLQPFECFHGPASRDARLAAEGRKVCSSSTAGKTICTIRPSNQNMACYRFVTTNR
jgi:hypothetical protein